MLLRFDPFRQLDRMLDEIQEARGAVPIRSMPMDAYRRGNTFVVHFDIPGVDRDSIELTIEKEVLRVAAERTWEEREGDEVVVRERPQGVFHRDLFLSETLDRDHIDASYDNGVLTITLPLVEQAQPRKIEVTTGGQPEAIDTTAAEQPGAAS